MIESIKPMSQDAQTRIALCRQAFRALHGLDSDATQPAYSLEDDDGLLRWARRHRVLGLLHAQARSAAPPWRNAAYGQAAFTARCTSLAERLQARFREAVPDIVLVKGPALARQAWPDLGMRSFDDLDYRCPFSAYDALCRTMAAEKCEPEHSDPIQQSHYWHFGWGIMFRHPQGILIEANHRAFPPHFPCIQSPTVEDERRCESLALDTETVRAPTPAHHLLICSMHLLWHGGERLGWVADIAGLLARYPDVFEQADEISTTESAFARRALNTACALAEKLLGPNLVQISLPMVSAQALRTLEEHLQSDLPPRPASVRALHAALLSPLEKTRYAMRSAFTPGDGDFRDTTFSEKRRWLYWIRRPWRILRKPRSPHAAAAQDEP